MSETRLLEVPIAGMDCAECTEHVRHAIAALPGVVSVDVFLASEKAAVRLDPAQVSLDAIRDAVEGAGYSVAPHRTADGRRGLGSRALTRQLGILLAALFGVVLFVAVVGEGLGLFERLTELVPWPVWLALVLIAGYPIFRNVIRATLHRQIISHTLMTIGVLAAIAVGQWVTALVVVFFMRVGDAVERFTTERARRSLKSLTALAPRTARVDRDGAEVEIPIDQLRAGEIVIVRPGEQIPVDGEVLDGQATVDQAAITGESLPVEAGPGSRVYAATIARLGHLRVRVTHAGADATFGRVVQLVEEAEANRGRRPAHRRSLLDLLPADRPGHRRADLRAQPRSAGDRRGAGGGLLVFDRAGDPHRRAGLGRRGGPARPADQGRSLPGTPRPGGRAAGGQDGDGDAGEAGDHGHVVLQHGQLASFAGCRRGNCETGCLRTLICCGLAASAERYSEHPLAEAVRVAAHDTRPGAGGAARFCRRPGWACGRRWTACPWPWATGGSWQT